MTSQNEFVYERARFAAHLEVPQTVPLLRIRLPGRRGLRSAQIDTISSIIMQGLLERGWP